MNQTFMNAKETKLGWGDFVKDGRCPISSKPTRNLAPQSREVSKLGISIGMQCTKHHWSTQSGMLYTNHPPRMNDYKLI